MTIARPSPPTKMLSYSNFSMFNQFSLSLSLSLFIFKDPFSPLIIKKKGNNFTAVHATAKPRRAEAGI